jgi:hypothetical protein
MPLEVRGKSRGLLSHGGAAVSESRSSTLSDMRPKTSAARHCPSGHLSVRSTVYSASFGRTNGAVQPLGVELVLGAECGAMSDLAHQSQPRVGVSVTLAVAWKRWRRALVDLRSRLDEGRDTDDLYIVALLSAVFVSDLAVLIALFSL